MEQVLEDNAYSTDEVASTSRDTKTNFHNATAQRCNAGSFFWGAQLLTYHAKSLKTKELLNALEKVFSGSALFRVESWVLWTCRTLALAFPHSLRVKNLIGVGHEVRGQKTEALNLYEAVLYEDPMNMTARHRVIASQKTDGNLVSTVDLLNEHLKEFPNDVQAWHELGVLYLSVAKYPQAQHCFEELLMCNPANPYYSVTLAEIHASLGSHPVALKYLVFSIAKGYETSRAYWDIVMVTSAILRRTAKLKKDAAVELEKQKVLQKHAVKRLLTTFNANGRLLSIRDPQQDTDRTYARLQRCSSTGVVTNFSWDTENGKMENALFKVLNAVRDGEF